VRSHARPELARFWMRNGPSWGAGAVIPMRQVKGATMTGASINAASNRLFPFVLKEGRCVVYRADNTTCCDMQRSIPRVILETIAMAAMVVLLLYVLYGPPT
jgi:hypothetical protein